MTANIEATDRDAGMKALAAELEEGDTFTVFAGEFIVDSVTECDARPIVRVRKKSVSGYMNRTYRMEPANPADEHCERIHIRTKYKSHWSVWSEFDAGDVKTDANAGKELVTDGGVDKTDYVDDATIQEAIEYHDDPEHEDCPTVSDIRELLSFMANGVEAIWWQWMDNIEDGYSTVVAEDDDVLVVDTGEMRVIEQEIEPYDGDVNTDGEVVGILDDVMHAAARERCGRDWSYTYPYILPKPNGVEDGQRYVEAFINGLLSKGLSPAEAWAYYGCEIRGNSQSSWAGRGDKDQSTISKSLKRAKKKLKGTY